MSKLKKFEEFIGDRESNKKEVEQNQADIIATFPTETELNDEPESTVSDNVKKMIDIFPTELTIDGVEVEEVETRKERESSIIDAFPIDIENFDTY